MTAAKPAILLMLADGRLRDIYQNRLERAGWSVDAAVNLVDAERRAVQLRPDVVLIDHRGLDDAQGTFKRFKTLPTLHQAKIVVTDKTLSASNIKDILAAGADAAVTTAHLTPQGLIKYLTQLIEQDV